MANRTTKRNTDKQDSSDNNQLTPELIEQITNQVRQQIVSEEEKLKNDERVRKEKQLKEHAAHIEKMKNSPDPWVEVMGWVDTGQGIRAELEWNDAFVEYLKQNGITGADEDQIVQQYVALLMRDVADDLDQQVGKYE